ncbi:MAG: DMT family transporter [Salinarimonas sp.]
MGGPIDHGAARDGLHERGGRRRVATAYLLLVLVILLWGANWPIMKIGLDSIPPLAFGAARMAIGAMTLFALLAATGRLAAPTRRDMPVVLSEGLLHMAAPIALMNLALQHVEAGRSAVLSFTTTLWIVPVAILVLGERVTPSKALGLAVGLVGVLVLFNPAALDWSAREVVIANALLMVAAGTWAAAILVARGRALVRTPLQLTPWQLLVAAGVLLVPALLLESADDVRWSLELALVLGFNGPIASGFCFWAALVVARDLPSIEASMGFLGVPVAGVLFSAAVLGEALTPSLVAGLAGIVVGIALVNLGDTRVGRRTAKGEPHG